MLIPLCKSHAKCFELLLIPVWWSQEHQSCTDRSNHCWLCILSCLFGCYAWHVVPFGDTRLSFGWFLAYLPHPLLPWFHLFFWLESMLLPISSVLSYAHCKCQGAIRREGNLQATLHVSSEGIKQPSHTTWNPLHSFNEHSEIVPNCQRPTASTLWKQCLMNQSIYTNVSWFSVHAQLWWIILQSVCCLGNVHVCMQLMIFS